MKCFRFKSQIIPLLSLTLYGEAFFMLENIKLIPYTYDKLRKRVI